MQEGWKVRTEEKSIYWVPLRAGIVLSTSHLLLHTFPVRTYLTRNRRYWLLACLWQSLLENSGLGTNNTQINFLQSQTLDSGLSGSLDILFFLSSLGVWFVKIHGSENTGHPETSSLGQRVLLAFLAFTGGYRVLHRPESRLTVLEVAIIRPQGLSSKSLIHFSFLLWPLWLV